ncbi:MAG: NADP-dependent malic enzyme [Rickettsiales bacterium]|nr:NADP-dependent malic enzyme [Rickettsiales bacterium]
MSENAKITDAEALAYHTRNQPGKLAITATKPLITQRDLSLGYSPGVAAPCVKINEDENAAYDYTAKGNLVAVVSNGTAVLGLGNLGALASKPVMEGKAILFKRFADIDGIDVEVDSTDVDEIVSAVKLISPTYGGINLEDIAAPDCFIIEQRLKEECDIPVFHDDQHGTAIITVAGLINATEITNRDVKKLKVVINGSGSAGIACLELIKTMGVPRDNILLCDRTGVIYEGRKESMNQWKSAHAVKTKARTLTDALDGADVFIGLSVAGAVTKDMIKKMAKNPIIFAMANPVPEIMPEEARAVRKDAIIATGRSDYPNQVNNVMGFPYIFRGALDVRAREINEDMKMAAANALAELAREDVPEEVSNAYSGRELKYGPEYIIPAPFDPRLITTIPVAVAKAAMDTGVARKPIQDFEQYRRQLASRLDPTANTMTRIFDMVSANPQRVIFAEGEEEKTIRAAQHWRDNGYGSPILVGRAERIRETMKQIGLKNADDIEIANAAISPHVNQYIDYLYEKLQRKGFLYRDIVRMVKNDRNIFASCMLACGHGDAMISGLTRSYNRALENISRVIDSREDGCVFGMSMLVSKHRTVFISDTTVQELPTAEELAEITIHTAEKARHMGHEPRAALLSYSNFGNPMKEKSKRIRDAVEILDKRTDLDFEYDGEMAADVALNEELMSLYPFCRLSGPANILVMPALHSANISSNLMKELGSGAVIGPILCGMERPVQIVNMNASVADVINLAAIASIEAIQQANKTPAAGKKKPVAKKAAPVKGRAAAKSRVHKAAPVKKAATRKTRAKK